MAIRAASTRRSQAASAQSGETVAIYNGTGVTVAGAVVSSSTQISLGTTVIGQTAAQTVTTASGSSGPNIANVQYLYANNTPITGDVAVSTLGGNILINGSNFVANSSIYVNNALVSNTFVSSTQIIATVPANTGNVSLFMFSPTNAGTAGPNIRYDVVPVWTTSAITLVNGIASNVALVATSDSTLTYTLYSGSLPTGMSLSSTGYITGTATGYTSTSATTAVLIATNQAGQPTQQTINFTVLIGDSYWPYDALLISASTGFGANTFVTDNSTSKNQLAIVGATKPQNFNPYQLGYYSVQFGGSDYLTMSASPPLMGTGFAGNQITIEGWIYPTVYTSSNSYGMGIIGSYAGVSANGRWAIVLVGSSTSLGTLQITYTTGTGSQNNVLSTKSFNYLNSWNHIAVTINATTSASTTINFFVNGVLTDSFTGQNLSTQTSYYTPPTVGGNLSSYINNYIGYMSNFRISSGLTYTSNFSVPTTPLLTNSSTAFLGLQSNRIIDISTANTGLTISGAPKVASANPFATTYQAGAPYYSTTFNGSSDYIYIPSNSTLALDSGNFTIECWVYLKAYDSGAQDRIFYPQSNSQNFDIGGATNSPGKLSYYNGSGVNSSAGVVPLNQWTHIACVRNGTTVSLYANGAQVATGTLSTTSPGASVISMGSDIGTGANYINGSISNYRITKNQALFTGNFTPSTTPLTISTVGATGANVASSITGTVVLLTCQNSTFVDNSTSAFTITPASTTVKPLAVSPFTQNSYTSNQITNFGSGYFNGSTDYLSTPYNLNLIPVSGTNFTAECWVYKIGTAAIYEFILGMNSTLVADWHIRNEDGSIITAIGGTTGTLITSTASILNIWTHLAIVQNNNTLYGYVNGVQAFSSAITSFTNNSLALTIGARSGTSDRFFNGYISDVRITKGTAVYTSNFTPPINSYNTALANTTLLTLQSNNPANNNGILDQSNFSSNNVITRTGTPTVGSFAPYGDNWSNYFDGSSGYLTSTISINLATPSAWTIEAWVYWTGSNANAVVIQKDGNYGTRYSSYGISLNGSGYMNIGVGSGNGTTYNQVATSNTALPTNQWVHLAFTLNSSNLLSLYQNGILVASATKTGTIVDDAQGITIGYSPGQPTSNYWSGYISNLRIVSGTALYTSNFTPSTSPLTAIANTVLLTCQSNRFVDNSPTNTGLTISGTTTIQRFSPFSTYTLSKYYSTAFNGTSDYLTVTPSSAFTFGTNNFTVEGWFYLNGLNSTADGIFQQGTSYFPASVTNTVAFGTLNTTNFQFYAAGAEQNFSPAVVPVLKQWYHFAVVRNSGTTTAYLNGVAGGSVADSTNYTGTYFGIGDIYNSALAYFMNGYISNLRVVNGTAVYTSNFTPSTTPLTAITNTVLLTCQNNMFVDNSVNNFAVSAASTTVKPLLISPFTPTASAITSYTPAQFGSSVYFNGSTDYTTSPSWPGLSAGTLPFTLEGWFYISGTQTSQATLYDMNGGTGAFTSNETCVHTNHTSYTNKLSVWVYNINSGSPVISSNTTLVQNTWYHMALVRNGTNLNLYVNGVLDTALTISSSITFDFGYSNGQGFKQSYNTADASSSYFTGYISDTRFVIGAALYNSNFYPGSAPLQPNMTGNVTLNGNVLALNSNITANSTVISSLLLNGTPGGVFDSARMSDIVTANSVVVASNIAPYSPSTGLSSVYFNGSSAYMTLPSSQSWVFGTGNFTIECWIYPTTLSTSSGVIISNWMFASGSYATGQWELQCDNNSSGQLAFFWATGSSATSSIASGTNYPTLNAWNHVAVVRNGTTITIYLNGTSAGSGTMSTTLGVTGSGVNAIGYQQVNSAQYFTGYISDVRITNGYARYVANFTPTTSAFPTK